ncbi:MAG TPA: MFS transporter [Caulifigura sp.]|nr:MFS transporter [Caulifigura sp.]
MRLSVMWLLEWGITGALLTYLPLYFTQNGLTLHETGPVLAIGAVGLWMSPLVVGQLCDRWIAAQRYMAIAHFLGGLVLLLIPVATEIFRVSRTESAYWFILTLFGLFAMLYLPTIPLASALTFRHLSDPKTQFGKVRIWGTVGWVLAGIGLSAWLEQRDVAAWLRSAFPSTAPTVLSVSRQLWFLPEPSSSDCFGIAAILSFALSSFCAFLPNTPPLHTPRDGIGLVGWAVAMWNQKGFVRLVVVASLLALVIPLYSLVVPKLLEERLVRGDSVPALMTIGQLSEFPALIFMPWCLTRLGLKATFALGVVAWIARYAIFAMNAPTWLVLAGVALHGVCHVYLIIVVQLYVDATCPRDLRATAQNVFAFVAGGVAMPLGLLLTQPLIKWCTDPESGLMDFGPIFAAPTLFLACVLLGFWKWFHVDDEPAAESGVVSRSTTMSESPHSP